MRALFSAHTALTIAAVSVTALSGCAATPTPAAAPTPVVDAPVAGVPCPTCGGPVVLVPGNWPVDLSGWESTDWSRTYEPEIHITPAPPDLSEADALGRARVRGRYGKLLRKLAAPADHAFYGPFCDYGRWEGSSYAGHDDLPPGDWVYVYPHWYVWESVGSAPVFDF